MASRYVLLHLDKERKLRFDINALADWEEVTGKSLARITSGAIGLSLMRSLLWAGLKHEDRSLTIDRVGVLLQQQIETGADLGTVAGSIQKALERSGLLGDTSAPAEDEAGKETADR